MNPIRNLSREDSSHALTSNRDGRGLPTAEDDKVLRFRPPDSSGIQPLTCVPCVNRWWKRRTRYVLRELRARPRRA